MPKFADIILPLPLNQKYTYAIPEDMQEVICVGMRVVVHFGVRKFYTGIVAALHDNSPEQGSVKCLSLLLDQSPIVLPTQLKLWQFVADYYRAILGDVYKAAIPSAMKLESETVVTVDIDRAAQVELTEKEMRLIEQIEACQAISIADLSNEQARKSVMPLVRPLRENGFRTRRE